MESGGMVERIVHHLKIWPKYYERVLNGSKTFEVRENDRDYQTGDLVVLQEWDPKTKEYTTSSNLRYRIGYVLPIDDLLVA